MLNSITLMTPIEPKNILCLQCQVQVVDRVEFEGKRLFDQHATRDGLSFLKLGNPLDVERRRSVK